MPATSTTPAPLDKANVYVVGIVKSEASLLRCLIGQIKLTRIHVLPVFLPGVRVKRDSGASLYNVERSGRGAFAGTKRNQTLSLCSCDGVCVWSFGITGLHQRMVEPDGIEPTT